MQYFLQYFKKFAILSYFAIFENFAISIAILRDFATLITILCDVAIPKYCNTLQYLLQYFTIGTTPAYHGTNSTKIINDYVSFARFVFNQSQSLFRKTRVYYELTESSLVSDGNMSTENIVSDRTTITPWNRFFLKFTFPTRVIIWISLVSSSSNCCY